MIDLNKALFFDIETHYGVPWSERSECIKNAFINHYFDPATYNNPEDHFHEVAGLHAEFSQVICVVFGYLNGVSGEFTTTSLMGSDEIKILQDSKKIFDAFHKNGFYLAGHNIIGCDVPYMAKRYIINGMKVPEALRSYGKKPWEVTYLDSMDLWKMTSWSRVSLETICSCLGISCKTTELGGSNLYMHDLKDMPWDELESYCKEDVISNYKFVDKVVSLYT